MPFEESPPGLRAYLDELIRYSQDWPERDRRLLNEFVSRTALPEHQLADFAAATTQPPARHDTPFDLEERFKATFEQAAVGMAHVSLDGRWEQVNQKMCEMLGYTREELRTQHFWETIHSDDLPTKLELTRQLLSGEIDTYSVELRYIRKDGSPLWVRQTASLICDANGEPRSKVFVVEDIRLRKAAEEARAQALKHTEDMVDVSQKIGLAATIEEVLEALITSADIAIANRATVALFDQPWTDTSPHQAVIAAVWNKGPQQEGKVPRRLPFEEYGLSELYRYEGPVVVTHINSTPSIELTETARNLLNWLGTGSLVLFPLIASNTWYGVLALHYEDETISEDLLSHVRGLIDQAATAIYTLLLLRAEANARREAQRANESKLHLLAIISHELRTPLTSIKGFVSTLLADDVEWDDDTQQDFLQTIANEADKLNDLIEQLLNHSRLENGSLTINMRSTTIDEVLSIAEAELVTLTENHDLSLEIAEELAPFHADPRRLSQVVVNLVNNAVKYTPEGTEITVRASNDDDELVVSILDEGPGIAPEEMEQIFDAFYQIGADKGVSGAGAGLGLTICKGIIAAHSGRLWAENRTGGGAVFIFTLPTVH